MTEQAVPATNGTSTRLLLATGLAAALAPLNSTMLSVAIRPIGAAFDTGEATLTSALVTSYLVTSIVAGPPCGKLADNIGHRRALALGQAAFALGSLVGVLAPNVATLTVARIAMAAAGSLVVPSGMALLRAEIAPEARGRVFGLFGATMAAAATLGPVVGGQLVSLWGWRALFAVNLLLAPLSAVIAGGTARPATAATGPRPPFDWRGSVLLGAALAALVLGASKGQSPNPWLLAGALVAFFAFVRVERAQASPVVDFALFRVRTYVASASVIALQNLAMYSLLFELPLVCGVALDAKASQVGPLLVAMMAPTILLSPIAGRVTDAWGPRVPAVLGTIAGALGLLLLRFLPLVSLASPVPGLLLVGVGLGLSNAPAQSAGMSAVLPAQAASAAGLSSTMRYLGGVVGTMILGVLFSVGPTRENILTIHHRAIWVFFFGLVLATGCAALLPGGRRAKAPDV